MPLTLYRFHCNLLQGATSSGKSWRKYLCLTSLSPCLQQECWKSRLPAIWVWLHLGHSLLIKCHQYLLPPYFLSGRVSSKKIPRGKIICIQGKLSLKVYPSPAEKYWTEHQIAWCGTLWISTLWGPQISTSWDKGCPVSTSHTKTDFKIKMVVSF